MLYGDDYKPCIGILTGYCNQYNWTKVSECQAKPESPRSEPIGSHLSLDDSKDDMNHCFLVSPNIQLYLIRGDFMFQLLIANSTIDETKTTSD